MATRHTIIACMAVSKDLTPDANTLGEIMGWGPNTFHAALSSNGSEPPTHFAFATVIPPETVSLLSNPGPTLDAINWSVLPLTKARAQAALGAMIYKFYNASEGSIDSTYAAFLAENNLQPVVTE